MIFDITHINHLVWINIHCIVKILACFLSSSTLFLSLNILNIILDFASLNYASPCLELHEMWIQEWIRLWTLGILNPGRCSSTIWDVLEVLFRFRSKSVNYNDCKEIWRQLWSLIGTSKARVHHNLVSEVGYLAIRYPDRKTGPY